MNLLGIISIDLNTNHLLVRPPFFIKHRTNMIKVAAVLQLFLGFKKAHNMIRQEVLYNILTEFGILINLFSLLIMGLIKTYKNTCLHKYFVIYVYYSEWS